MEERVKNAAQRRLKTTKPNGEHKHRLRIVDHKTNDWTYVLYCPRCGWAFRVDKFEARRRVLGQPSLGPLQFYQL